MSNLLVLMNSSPLTVLETVWLPAERIQSHVDLKMLVLSFYFLLVRIKMLLDITGVQCTANHSYSVFLDLVFS